MSDGTSETSISSALSTTDMGDIRDTVLPAIGGGGAMADDLGNCNCLDLGADVDMVGCGSPNPKASACAMFGDGVIP